MPQKWNLKILYLFLFFIFSVGVFLFNTFSTSNSFTQFVQIAIGAFLLFFSGASFVVIIQFVTKRQFSAIEFLTFSLLSSILLFPILLEMEFLLLGKVSDLLPLSNILIISFIAVFLIFSRKTTLFPFQEARNLASSIPFILSTSIYLLFITLIVSTFPSLPDLDPYKWLYKYSYLFSNLQIDRVERPLFGAITFLGTRLLGVDIFTFYKYVLPFFLATITTPAWLIATRFKDSFRQFFFLAFTFTSPVALLYGTTAMPQQPIIVLAYFFAYLLLYASLKKDDFFLYMAGLISFFGFFYHQSAALLFAVWIIIMILSKFRLFLSNKPALFFAILFIGSNIAYFKPIGRFLANWLDILYKKFFLGDHLLNLYYPAIYTNIDRNMMGWPGFTGIAKFYAFHMGPITGIILIIFICLLFQKKFRVYFWEKVTLSPEILIGFCVFFIFFLIAEILPRFPNIALLPDRAWIFAGIFSVIPAFLLLEYRPVWPKYAIPAISIAATVGIFGALYVNSLKQYLVTPAQWQSAQWIIKNLPENRLFLSSGNKNLLPVHASSRLLRIPQVAYCDNLTEYEKIMAQFRSSLKEPSILDNQPLDKVLQWFREQYHDAKTESEKILISQKLADKLTELQNPDILNDETISGLPIIFPPYNISKKIDGNLNVEDVFRSPKFNYTLGIDDKPYIYFSRKHEKNPYGNRPYSLSTWGFSGCPNNAPFVFDLYPEKFKKIYDDNNEIIIWEVL